MYNNDAISSFSEPKTCADEPCLNGGTCTDVTAGYQCTCTSGFTGTDCETGECYAGHIKKINVYKSNSL